MRTSHWAEELKILNYIYSKKLYINSVQHTGLGSLNVKLNTANSKHNSGSHLPEHIYSSALSIYSFSSSRSTVVPVEPLDQN